MPRKTKLEELEEKLGIMFGGNFISLSTAARAVSGKNFKLEDELTNLNYFSMSESSLKRYAKEDRLLITVYKIMSVGEMCSLIPKKRFVFNLYLHEIVKLKKEVIRPRRYLIRNQPRFLSSGGRQMRDLGFRIEENPTLPELIYADTVCELTGRRILSIENSRILCSEEVQGRFGKTPVYFQKCSDGTVQIGAWPSQIPSFNVLPVMKV